MGLKEVGLGAHVGHDLGPFGHHGITLALHFGSDSIEEDGESPNELRHLLGEVEIVGEEIMDLGIVLLGGRLGIVSGCAHGKDGLSSGLTTHHSRVDALTSKGIDVSGGVTDDDEMVVMVGLEALATKTKGGGPHALDLGVGTDGLGNEGVLGEGVIVETGQIGLGDFTTLTGLDVTAGNEVVAVVELIVGVPEDGGVTGERPLGIETNTIEVGVVGTTLDECAGANTAGSLSAVAELGGEGGGGTIRANEDATLDGGSTGRGDSPEPGLLVKGGTSNLEVLLEVSAGAGSALGNTVVKNDTLDGTSSGFTKLLLGNANVGDTLGADEATIVGKVALVVVLQLLENAHVLEDPDGGSANGITAVLVTRERFFVKKGDLGASLGKVVTANGARRTGTDNNGIISTLRKSANRVRTRSGNSIHSATISDGSKKSCRGDTGSNSNILLVLFNVLLSRSSSVNDVLGHL
mmetsp:Transcript_1814/g.2629  ORF Transcript_1814/g.2629 Transcript_1814/m.2629 type:complete len:465 (-) Transcript_1814:102-1496(-)